MSKRVSKKAKPRVKTYIPLPDLARQAIRVPLVVRGVVAPAPGVTYLKIPETDVIAATFHTTGCHPDAYLQRAATAHLATHAMAQLLPLCTAAVRALHACRWGKYSTKICKALTAMEEHLKKAYEVR